jgi:hypothetical protein
MRPSLLRSSIPYGVKYRLASARGTIRPVLLAVSLLGLGVSGAIAQSAGNYDLPGMNFDLWCQEQAHLPAAQCDKRTPEDEKTFDDFRDKVDRYEIPYLQRQQKDLAVHRDIMQNDQVDNPLTQDPLAQTQDPNRQPPLALP